MKWSEKDFRARVKMHAARRGLTITEVLKRAGVTEDYLRHPPEGGRNISAILKIAEVLTVNPAELMGLELSHEERRSTPISRKSARIVGDYRMIAGGTPE